MDLGYCSVLEHDIDTGDAEPIRQPPRRPPLSARQAEEDILNEMLQTGVIEPSNSPFSSPVCMVRKKGGSYRYCVDYRRMNFVTIKDAYPVPDVKDPLDSLRGAKYFARIDLLSGYWQLGMTQRARERSAFCTIRAGRLHSNADAISRQNCKQCWGKVASDNCIDECERADQLVEPLSLHTIQLRSEFSDDVIAELQAEDSEIGKAYEVVIENLDPSTDEFRALPLESRRLLSMQPEVRLQDNLLVKERH